jgi:hypothetical protein
MPGSPIESVHLEVDVRTVAAQPGADAHAPRSSGAPTKPTKRRQDALKEIRTLVNSVGSQAPLPLQVAAEVRLIRGSLLPPAPVGELCVGR